MERRDPLWIVDPEDPRAPPTEIWNQMTEEERDEVVASLPVSPEPLQTMPPGQSDPHFDTLAESRFTLRRHFGGDGRNVYIGNDLATYYPNERVFAPDLIAVLDVGLHPRSTWNVEEEGRGLDLALEVNALGDRKKDFKINVLKYARLGIAEYFAYDHRRQVLRAYRLASPEARVYEQLVPQGGRFPSNVLGLKIGIEEGRLRFYAGDGALLAPAELADRLERMVDESTERAIAEARRADAEAERAEAEAERAEAEAERADRLERLVAELQKQLDELKGKKP